MIFEKVIKKELIEKVHSRNCKCYIESIPFSDSIDNIDDNCTSLRNELLELLNAEKSEN
jgi:3-oxoacyl-ACP reductase-like protein